MGTSALIPEFGGLVGNAGTPMLNAPLPERVMKYEVTEKGVRFNDKIMLPFEPFIGTLGVSPQIEAVLSLQPDYWGGNMDLPDVAPGAILYFPVQTKGAYLFLGDCHGRQGDGEFCGVAVEIPSTTTIHVDLIKSWSISWPRLENAAFPYDDRLCASDGGRGQDCLSRVDPLVRRRLRPRRYRGLFPANPSGQAARRQHGRSKIYAGRVDFEEIPAV